MEGSSFQVHDWSPKFLSDLNLTWGWPQIRPPKLPKAEYWKMLHVLLSKSLPLFYEERRATIKVTEAVEATEAEVYKANRPVFLLLRSRPNIFEGLLLKYCIAQFRWTQRPLRPVLLRNVNQTEDNKKRSPFFQVILC